VLRSARVFIIVLLFGYVAMYCFAFSSFNVKNGVQEANTLAVWPLRKQPLLASAGGKVEVVLSRKKVATGEVFSYSIKVQGEFKSPKLKLPTFEGLAVVAKNESRNYSTKAGKTQMTYTLTLHLFGPNPGTFTIVPATIEDEGKTYKSKSVTVTVEGKPLEEKKKIQPFIKKGIAI